MESWKQEMQVAEDIKREESKAIKPRAGNE
jgi:hypothetical protein